MKPAKSQLQPVLRFFIFIPFADFYFFGTNGLTSTRPAVRERERERHMKEGVGGGGGAVEGGVEKRGGIV